MMVDALPTASLYSDDLAQKLDVSVRTLQTAMQAIRGVSLHHYLRFKQLWRVRAQLLSDGHRAAAPAN
jgi:AraC-like DNA-binding protein